MGLPLIHVCIELGVKLHSTKPPSPFMRQFRWAHAQSQGRTCAKFLQLRWLAAGLTAHGC